MSLRHLSEAHQESLLEGNKGISSRTRQSFTEKLRKDYLERDTRYMRGRSYYHELEDSIWRVQRFIDKVGQEEGTSPELIERIEIIKRELAAREAAHEVLTKVASEEIEELSRYNMRVIFLSIGFAGWNHPIDPSSSLLDWR